MGSIFAARRAGRYDANKAVKNRITPTETITEESIAPTPYKVVRMVRPTIARLIAETTCSAPPSREGRPPTFHFCAHAPSTKPSPAVRDADKATALATP